MTAIRSVSRGSASARKRRNGRGPGAVPDLMAQLHEAEIRVRLREARDQAGLSRERLADILTVHRKSIENYETKRVPWSLVNAWAAATGTTVEYLLHGKAATTTDAMDDARLARIETLLEEIRDALTPRAAEAPPLAPDQYPPAEDPPPDDEDDSDEPTGTEGR